MGDPYPPILCFRLDVYFHCVPCPPRGVAGFTASQVKGNDMDPNAADVVFAWTPDVDPHAVSTETTVSVNGTVVGTITLPNASTGFNYLSLSPAPPALNNGDVVTASNVTTDDMAQTSPAIPCNPVTIQAAQPAPVGVSDFVARQVGAPTQINKPGASPAPKKS